MRKKIFWLLILTALSFLFYTCRKDSPSTPPINFGYNYIPENVGHYVIYEVDSIAYDDISHAPDTTRYLLKELIDSIYTDNTGKPAMRIERYFKHYNDSIPYSDLPWEGPRIWSARKSANDYQKVEENVRYLRLVFPATEGKQWDGNLYNPFQGKDYEITSSDKGEWVNSIYFDSVVTVLQFEKVNFIEYRYEQEKYARNIGLIYKEVDSLYDGGGPDTVGFTYKQMIVSYGN